MAYVLTAKWTAQEGREEEVRDHILALVEPSRAEPGVLVYQPHQDPENPRVFFVYEQYADEAAFKAHGETEHFKRHGVEGAIPLLESRERAFYETIGA
jgi:quinol monooxygenase YgiN